MFASIRHWMFVYEDVLFLIMSAALARYGCRLASMLQASADLMSPASVMCRLGPCRTSVSSSDAGETWYSGVPALCSALYLTLPRRCSGGLCWRSVCPTCVQSTVKRSWDGVGVEMTLSFNGFLHYPTVLAVHKTWDEPCVVNGLRGSCHDDDAGTVHTKLPCKDTLAS